MEESNISYDAGNLNLNRKEKETVTVTFTAEDGKILDRLKEEEDPKAFLIRLIKRAIESHPNVWLD